MKIEAQSYPMLERKVRNPIIKESFEVRMERRQKRHDKKLTLLQEQHKKNPYDKAFWDCVMDYNGAFESDVKGV